MTLQTAITTADLARLLRVNETILINLAFNVPDNVKYNASFIPKRNGQPRALLIPSLRLKMIQRRLLSLLENLYIPGSRVHGYVEGRGLRTNATPHIGKRYVLNIDLQDFFGTVTFQRIRGRLKARPYGLTDAIATTIARLTTCNGSLPIGSPTSPIISNIMCSGLDSGLAELAKSRGCFYTRYADDLTFSTNRRSFPRSLAEREDGESGVVTIAGSELSAVISLQGFAINPAKTRLLTKSDRQEVCGVVCNEKLNVLPKLKKEIRGALHAWRKFGLEDAEKEWESHFNYRNAASFEDCIRGKLEFFKHIRGASDPIVVKYVQQFNELRQSTLPISVPIVRDWQSELARTSCCIHSYMNVGDDMVQGSGFLISGGYIVTNRHVVAKGAKRFDTVEVVFPGSIKIPIEVEVISELPAQDLALLRAKDDVWQQTLATVTCEVSDVPSDRNDVVWLTGWPNYYEGDDVHLIQGVVTGFSYPEGVKVFRIAPNIVFGNSGGAVFDESGRVVGIATRGSDLTEAPLNVHNGCVPASWIEVLVDQYDRSQAAMAPGIIQP